LTCRFLKQAGVAVCLAFCAACAQVALMSVSPMMVALASHLDQATARDVVDLEKKQDWSGMLKLARLHLQRDPDRTDWWFLQGYALARQGKHAEAIESYEFAIRLSPEEEGAWLALGRSLIEVGQTERAIQTYMQVLRYRPESAQAYLALGDIYQKQEKLDLAISNYRECVRYDTESVPGWYGLAGAYQLTRQNGRRDEALQNLRKLAPAIADQFEKQYPSK
jgi:tetratricopeptide (TPR) repeat protein